MAAKIAVNGFGRIGRYLVRLLAQDGKLLPAYINARADNASLAHLLKYDSVYGKFPGTVEVTDKGFAVNGKEIEVTRFGLNEWKWADLGVDLVIESTGKIKDKAGAAKHLDCGAKKVIVSAPCKDADATFVMGVNDSTYDAAAHKVVSAASCTTNCLAPAAKVIHETFGIESGVMTTIHSYTMDQRLLDGSHKDLRRARAAALSMVPTTTGAAKAVSLVLPALKGKLDGFAVRVPTPTVSLVDLTCHLAKDATKESVNAALKAAAEGPLKDNMGYTEEPLVSMDFKADDHGGVVDAQLTTVMDNRLLKIIVWYDNESGFTNQLVRLIAKVSASM